MLIVAVTGGIGSGKSTVVELFRKKGVPVVDTDIIARDVVQDNATLQKLTESFGQGILNADGSLNRAKLRALAFETEENKMTLNEILHPLIYQHTQTQLAVLDAPYCVLVIPLLFETRSPYQFDRVLVVDVEQAQQLNRAIQRDTTSESDIQKIIAAQASREQRLSIADDVIDNNGEIMQLAPQVDALHQKYLALAKHSPPN